MTMTEKTCEQRLPEHLAGREQDLTDLIAIAADDADELTRDRQGIDTDDPEQAAEEASERLWGLPLSVETVTTVKVLLSTGGPADGFTFDVDTETGEVGNLRYWFADWFDYAETRVPEGSPLWAYAEDIKETMGV